MLPALWCAEMLFDSHAHWDDERFDLDRDKLLAAVHQEGVGMIMNAGASLRGCFDSVQLANRYPFVYAAVGIHPGHVDEVDDSVFDTLRTLAENPKVKAVGEIGLDYHYDGFDRDLQIAFFMRQLRLAEELGLPVIVHDREAHQDTLDCLAKTNAKGVMHCYSGSVEMMKLLLKKDFYVGFGGTVTYKNARQVVETAMAVPLNRMLIETDSPYLPPVPHRGERNHSGYVHLVAEKLAELRGLSVEEIEQITFENARRCFAI